MAAETLRIAQVAPLWAKIPPHTYGGIELAVNLLVEELVRRGHDVTLFASADCATSARLCPVCDEHLLALMEAGRAFVGDYYINAAVAEALRRAGEFDVIHFHTGAQWVPFGAAAAALGTPPLFTLHTALSPDDQWVLARHPEVQAVAISRYQAEGITPPPPVVYNGCDFDAYEPCYEPGSYLAFLGRMSEYKNPLGAIELARAAGMPILLAGRAQNAAERAYFEEKIAPLVDGRCVRYLGPVAHAEKNALLAGAAALVFPIRWAEPFGLVMIEAMACGTPVLAARLGSVEEVIDDGVTGFSAAEGKELAAALPKTLALDRRRVREHARRRFHFPRMVDRYERLYRTIRKG